MFICFSQSHEITLACHHLFSNMAVVLIFFCSHSPSACSVVLSAGNLELLNWRKLN